MTSFWYGLLIGTAVVVLFNCMTIGRLEARIEILRQQLIRRGSL